MNPEKKKSHGMPAWSRILLLAGLMNIFFVAISLMGAFKEIGSGYGLVLMNELAHNPFVGLFMGILITAVIQSSSATSSLVVGLVAGGALGDSPAEAISLAIPIIMGANIGTSVTNVIVSLAHIGRPEEFRRAFSVAIVHDFFNVIAVLVFFPLQLATDFLGKSATFVAENLQGSGGATFESPIKLLVSPQKTFVTNLMTNEFAIRAVVFSAVVFILLQALRLILSRRETGRDGPLLYVMAAALVGALFSVMDTYGHVVFHASTATFVLALALLFAALVGFVNVMRSLVLDKVERIFNDFVFRNAFFGLLFGLLVTAVVQSSSVTTSIVVPLAGAGLVTIQQVFPFTLGANIGTTVTALLAALASGSMAGLSVALAHLLFNVFGILLIFPFRKVPIALAEAFADLALRSRAIPIVFIVGLYLVLPFLFIFFAQ
ncbi:MAG: Na/Pi symporter [Pseudomonadota bacterium]